LPGLPFWASGALAMVGLGQVWDGPDPDNPNENTHDESLRKEHDMQHYLYHGTPSPQSHLTRAAIEKPAGDGHFYKLFEGDAVRLAKACGLRAGASFLALAVHSGCTSLKGRTCFPKVPTAARLTGQSTRATSGHFRGLEDDGFIKIQRRKRASSIYTVAHSDS